MANVLEEAVVHKSLRVQAPIERAFSVFVEQMETWWPASHRENSIRGDLRRAACRRPVVREKPRRQTVRLGHRVGVASAASGRLLMACWSGTRSTGLEVRPGHGQGE